MSPSPLLVELLVTAARRDLDAAALEIPAGSGRAAFRLSYGELLERAACHAAELRGRLAELPGGGAEPLVALHLARTSPGVLAWQVACLAAGVPYLSLDPSLPDDHAAWLLEDGDVVLVVCDEACAERSRDLARGRAVLARDWRPHPGGGQGPDLAELPSVPADRLAYVIYTSGTTGRPKGVEVEQGSIANLVAEDLEVFGLGPGDRCSWNSSPSYDSSLEEVWLALAAGATLVVMDDEVVRSGPDLVGWLRAQRITVLCPPPTLLRTTGCTDVAAALPDLRWVYVGGEALPADLAATWGPGSRGLAGPRLVNGYGPTECTVTCLRSEVVEPGDVRIGRPVRGARARIVGEDGALVPDGEDGELWIAGACLARGYLGRPDLTAERFPEHPLHGRCYRTGDLVRRPVGSDELVYLGRIDAQVQLRGHRIELAAVEARLVELDSVAAAAATLDESGGRPRLVAWLVPGPRDVPGDLPDLVALRAALAEHLPEPMVPAALAWLDALPTSVGGKLDRGALPSWRDPAVAVEPPAGPLEARLVRAFGEALGLGQAVGARADFFRDLGGDSLAAATLVSLLRQDADLAHLAVRDLYGAPTPRALAARAWAAAGAPDPHGGARGQGSAPASRPPAAGRAQRAAFTAAQLAVVALELLALALVLRFVVLGAGLRLLASADPWLLLLVAGPALVVAALVLALPTLGVARLAKALLIGRYRAGRFPAFGSFHLRHWLVVRLARRLPWGLVSGTRLGDLYLRALGARVGAGVHLDRGVDLAGGGWDLVELGDGVCVEQDARLRAVDLDGGELVVGPVRVGAGASLAVRASMGPGTALGAGARLGELAHLEPGAAVPACELWTGTPAVGAGQASEAGAGRVAWEVGESRQRCGSVRGGACGPGGATGEPRRALGPPAAPHGRLGTDLGLLGGGALLAWLRSLPTLGLAWLAFRGASGSELAHGLSQPGGSTDDYLLAGLVLVAGLLLDLLVVAGLVRALGARVARAGTRFAIFGAATGPWVCRRLAVGLVEGAGTWLSGGLFWPPWLRLAGMRVGPGSEVSTILGTLPRDVELGADCFLADGVYLGGPRLHGGWVERAPTRLGSDSFVGNHAVLPGGADLPGELLVGVCTVARSLPGPGAWFGQPPFELPRPGEPEFDRSLTHEPSLVRRVNRLTWEGARLLLPLLVPALVGVALAPASRAGESSLVGALLGLLVVGTGAYVAVLALKWLLLGRVGPGSHPLWSCWCSRWDFLYVVWGRLARPVLATFEGTLVLGLLLRPFGMRLGPGVLLGPGFAQVVDPDMLRFEAGATVSGLFQAHTFEDRVLKIGHVDIGPGATLGADALAFYGTRLEAGSRARPGAVALKGETLSAGRDHAGVPLAPLAPL